MIDMSKKRDYDYFEMFVKGVAYSCKAAHMNCSM